MVKAGSTEPRSFIDQALERAEATGHSAYLLVSLDPDERAKAALAAWTSALAGANLCYAMRSSGRRTFRDRGGYERAEIDEMLIEVWPDRQEWAAADASTISARQSPMDDAALAPR